MFGRQDAYVLGQVNGATSEDISAIGQFKLHLLGMFPPSPLKRRIPGEGVGQIA